MAPEKTDLESGDDTANTSTISLENNTSISSETSEREPYFEPLVHLPEIKVKTNEEDESELLRLRCKLFRYFNQETPAEWKERGTGDVKILHNVGKKTVRLIMRQDKTLKIRANHYVTPFMNLKPSCNSDRAFVWSSTADFADEEIKQETFAIRFANSEHAKIFKQKFYEAKNIICATIAKTETEGEKDNLKSEKDASSETESSKQNLKDASEEVSKDLSNLSVTEKEETKVSTSQ